MKKQKHYHHVGQAPDGSEFFAECSKGVVSEQIMRALPIASGDAVPPGAKLVFIHQEKGSVNHFVVEDVLVGGKAKGPTKVSTTTYRVGWKRTFGKNGVN